MKAIFGFIVKHKVLSIISLSLATLASGGVVAFNVILSNLAKTPEVVASPETFEYVTLSSLKQEYAVSEEEQAKDISTYSSDEGFNVYKRSFYNFLTTDKYRIVTTGYTNASNILVNINNEKKFDGTNYFMHLQSRAENGGKLGAVANRNAMHYLYVTEDNSRNLATIKILDAKDSSVVKQPTVFTEKDYVYNYGAIPYTACNFTIKENTVNTANFSYDDETGLYKIEMELKPVEATEGLIKQMHAVSGVNASYEDGSVSYTAYVDSSFIIRRADIKEIYQVSTLGINTSGESETRDDFYYEGDENFYQLTEEEKYDLTNIPVEEDESAVAFTKSLSQNAVARVKENGVNADFSFSADDISLDGRLQISFGNVIVIKADAAVKGVPVSIVLSLDKEKSGVIVAEVNDFKAGLEFTRIGDTIGSLLPTLGIDLGGFDVRTIIDSIDVNGLIDAFGGIKGTQVSETVYVFEPNLSATGIPLDLPFKMTVENGKIISFAIDGENVMGIKINLSLTPSQAEKDLTVPTIDETVCNLSGILSSLTEKDDLLSTLAEIIKTKTVGFNVSADLFGIRLTGSVSADLQEISDPKISAEFSIDGFNAKLFYRENTVYVKTDTIAVYATVDEIKDYISVFTDLDALSAEKPLNIVKNVLSSVKYETGTLSIDYKNLNAEISDEKISVSYGETVSAEISGLSGNCQVATPEGDFVKLEGLKPLLAKINEELSTRYFTANGSVTIGNTLIRFENIKIFNEGSTTDPTEAFDNGDLTLSGTLYITASGQTHKLFIHYINSTLFVEYKDSMKIKLSRASLDYIVDLIKTNYKAIIDRFNYSEIINADNTLTKLKDYKFTVGSVVNLLQAINVEDGKISLTVKANDFGFDDAVELKAYMANNNLALDVRIGDNNGNISLDNTPFDKPAAPTGNYIDLSGITGLAEAAVNAILKPSEEYYLSGSIRVVIPVVGINLDVNINMDASVRLVSDGNGGKKIEAVAHVSCYDTTADISLARSYLKCGKGTLVYKDETFYITRVNEERKRVLLIPKDTWETKSTTRRAMTRSYFGKTIMAQLGFFMGLGDEILSKFTENKDTQIEKCLKSYSATNNTHTIVLDGKALTGSSELGNMTLAIGITNKQLTSLNVSIPISVSILDMTATVNLTHDPSKKGDYTDITNLKPSQFGTVLQ